MKKKILLVLCLAIAICAIFAISVSADEITPPTRTNIQVLAEDVVVFHDGNSCPSAYIFKDQTNIPNGAWGNAGLKQVLDFEYANQKFGKTYSVDDIKELDIPQGITTIGSYVAHSMSTLKKISLPSSVTSLGATGFQGAKALEECVFEHTDENSGPTSLDGWMFEGCSSLKAISLPDSITTITGEGNIFSGCNNLTAVYLPKNLQTIDNPSRNGLFQYLSKVYLVNTPFTTSDTAPAKPSVYYFPANLRTISGKPTFENCTSLNDVLVFGSYFTDATMTNDDGKWLFSGVSSTIVFLGDMIAINTADKWGSSKIIFANPADKSSDDIATYTNARTTLFCASESDMSKHLESPKHSEIAPATCYSNKAGIVNCFCGREISRGEYEGTMLTTHNYVDDFDCTTPNYCENYGEGKCDQLVAQDADSHAEAHEVIFANGFTSAGVHNTYCSNSTCKALDAVENLNAMFTPNGYSYKEKGSAGVSAQFAIDTHSLKTYEKYEGALHFGIIIANANHFAEVDAFIENGEITATNTAGDKSGLQVEMATREYDYFNCSISGFDLTNTQHTALGLVIAGYVYGEDGKITYIQKQYETDNDDATTETPYVSTLTKDGTLGVVAITAVQTFEPIASNEE